MRQYEYDYYNYTGPYYPTYECVPGYLAVCGVCYVARQDPPCNPRTRNTVRTVTVTQNAQTRTVTQRAQTRTVTRTRTVTQRPQTRTVSVTSSSVRTVTVTATTTRAFYVLPNITRTTLRQLRDPFVPFCDPSQVIERRAELQSLIGRDTGMPIPDRAVVLLEFINYCQVCCHVPTMPWYAYTRQSCGSLGVH